MRINFDSLDARELSAAFEAIPYYKESPSMKSKRLTTYTAVVVILLSWFVTRTLDNRHDVTVATIRNNKITEKLESIKGLESSLLDHNDMAAVSIRDLNAALKINRFEGQIRELRMENAIERTKGNSITLTDIIFIFLLMQASRGIVFSKKENKEHVKPTN